MPGKTRPTKSTPTAAPATGGYTLGSFARNTSDLQDVTLPSGATCQARRPGVQGLIAAGLLDNFDELTALVQTSHIDPQSPKGRSAAGTSKITKEDTEAATDAMMRDPSKLAVAFHMMDKLAAYVITQPLVWVDYQQEGESDADWLKRKVEADQNGALAVRQIDMDDKMFLLNWAVGGASDLAAFREGRAELVAGMAAS